MTSDLVSVILIIIPLLVASVTSQTIEFDPSLDDVIYINRSQENVVLYVVRTGGVNGNVTVTYNITSTGGIVPFSNPTGMLIFVKDSVQMINLSLINDNTLEVEDEYIIRLHVSGNATLGNRDTLRLVILNVTNNATRICFGKSSVHINENHQSLMFTLNLTDPLSTDITVTVITTDGTATGGEDYEPGPITAMVSAGNISSFTFNITIIDDNTFESNESFILTIDSSTLPSRVLVQPDCMTVVTIVDDDIDLVVGFPSSLDVKADENSGIAQPTLVFNRPSAFIETVQLEITEIRFAKNLATEGVDYDSGPYTAIFPAGSTSATFNVTIRDDNLLEVDEDIHFEVISITNNHIIAGLVTGTVTIIDTTTTSVCFNQSSVSIIEGQGSIMITAVITNLSAINVSIGVITTDITTTGGAHGDYKSGPFNVTILPGNNSGSYNLSITDDNIFETNETFNLTINASSLPSRVLLQPNCMIICTIIDNDDVATVSFVQSSYTIEEDRIIQPMLILSNPSSFVETIQVFNTDVSATGGVDYNSGPYNVTFLPGSTIASFDILINDDGVFEKNEVFNISIISITNGHNVGTPAVSTVTIMDTNMITVNFHELAYSVDESIGVVRPVLVLSNPSSFVETVQVITTDISANGGGIDYYSGPYNVTILNGSNVVLFDILINEDNVFEENERFNIYINSVSNAHIVGIRQMARVTIIDNNMITVRFSQSSYSVDEDVGIVQPVLVLSNPSSFIETVQVIATNVSGNGGGVDYDFESLEVTFPIGSTNVSFDIIINDDDLFEETFDISIASITNGHTVGTPGVATVIIVDTAGQNTSSNTTVTATDTDNSSAIIGGVVGGTALLIVLIILCIVMQRIIRSYKKKRGYSTSNVQFTHASVSILNPNLDHNSNPYVFELTNMKANNLKVDLGVEARVAKFEEWRKQLGTYMIDYNNLTFEEAIAKGHFGVVYKALHTNDTKQTKVAIKTLKDVSSTNVQQFIDECIITSKLDHPNVLSLLGVSINPDDATLYMIMPFMDHGDVKSFLKSKRGDVIEFNHFPEGLSYDLLMNMCLDVAKGMEHLSSRRFVHRDLAARNCMLDENLTVKVADFGLSRDVYVTDYYVMNKSNPLPVKWLAPEALFDKVFSENTDVWAFGVTCWEIFSLGLQPYPTVDPFEMGDYLKSHKVLDKPSLSSDEMYEIMRSCWNFGPEDRPCFVELVQDISQQVQLMKDEETNLTPK